MTRDLLLARAKGAFLGAASGWFLGRAGAVANLPPATPAGAAGAEFLALAARALIAADADFAAEPIERLWRELSLGHGEPAGLGGAEQDALRNLREGLHVPECGRFGSRRLEDGAAVRAVASGVLWYGRPEEAAEAARLEASVTHAYDGQWAAAAVAAAIAAALGAETPDPEAVVEAALQAVPADSWLRYRLMECCDLAGEGGDLAAVAQGLAGASAHLPAGLALESVPVALALYTRQPLDPRALVQAVVRLERQSAGTAAVAAALAAAGAGAQALPAEWLGRIQVLGGLCFKALAGDDLGLLAVRLIELRERVERQMAGQIQAS